MTNFLKRIELQGFKSFAEKTILDFPARVVAIVGPNGSGKSNIVDALRWVLGEREAKKLRGETLDKLIFAGSTKSRAVGLARVVLHFNNNEQVFPIDSEEVEIERMINRAGASEFQLNGSEIRLKDLMPILARAKLGTRGLTIIGQGESDIFVRSNPEERRKMVEEILGLKEFRLKKHTAERRLNTSLINMEKIQALIQELKPHLRFLRRQQLRFKKRSEIEEKLKSYEDKYFSFHFCHLTKLAEEIEKPIAGLREAKVKKEAEIRMIEKNLKEINDQAGESEKMKKLRSDLNELLNKKFSLKENLGRLEAEIEIKKSVSREDVSFAELKAGVKDFIKKVEEFLGLDDVHEIKKRLRESIVKLKKLLKGDENDSRECWGRKKELERALVEIDKEIKNLEEEGERLTYVQEELNQEFRRQVEKLESKKNELRKIENEIQSALFEKEKVELKFAELERQWRATGREENELKDLLKKVETMEERGVDPDLERKIMHLRAELAAIGEIDKEVVQEAKEKEERYKFLKKEVHDLEVAIRDLKNLIKELDSKIHFEFKNSFKEINEEFNKYFRLMFGGGRAKLKLQTYRIPKISDDNNDDNDDSKNDKSDDNSDNEKGELKAGVEIDLSVPQKSLKGIEMLSGGEKSLVSMAALFALISVSPPPFLVLDEIDAALDEENASRFAELIKEFSKRTQFILVTHNRATMEIADVLYGVTMGEDGVSKILSLKLE